MSEFAVTESNFRFLKIKLEVLETKLLKIFKFWKIMALDLIKPIGYLMRIFLLVPNLLLNTNFGIKRITYVIFCIDFINFFQKREIILFKNAFIINIEELD